MRARRDLGQGLIAAVELEAATSPLAPFIKCSLQRRDQAGTRYPTWTLTPVLDKRPFTCGGDKSGMQVFMYRPGLAFSCTSARRAATPLVGAVYLAPSPLATLSDAMGKCEIRNESCLVCSKTHQGLSNLPGTRSQILSSVPSRNRFVHHNNRSLRRIWLYIGLLSFLLVCYL